jgi:hypothetical protein
MNLLPDVQSAYPQDAIKKRPRWNRNPSADVKRRYGRKLNPFYCNRLERNVN